MKTVWMIIFAVLAAACAFSFAGEAGAPADGEAGVYFNVYELFKIEDDEVFEKKLKEIPGPYRWMNPDHIRARRSQYQEELRKVRKKYEACQILESKESLSVVFKELGGNDLPFLYGLCRRAKEGRKGCGVLKKSFPDDYRRCMDYDDEFWTKMAPFVLREKITEKDMNEITKSVCDARKARDAGADSEEKKKNPAEKKINLRKCPENLRKILRRMRVVLYNRDEKKCGALKDKDSREACRAAFKRDMDYCDTHDYQCTEGKSRFIIGSAIALSDAAMLDEHVDSRADNFLAHYYIDGSYCDSIYNETLVPACEELERNAIAGIRVLFP